MKNLVFIFILLIFISCATEPQPLLAGKDVCNFCKMPVAETKFGGEIITEKGKLYKFDDLGCMYNFLKKELGANENVKTMVAVNYSHNQKFMDVRTSAFLTSPDLHSPMNSGAAAFESKAEAEFFLKDFPGEILTWDQLQQKLN